MSWDSFARVWRAFSGITPFQPFTLELKNGSRVEIHHPEALRRHGQTDLLVYRSTSDVSQVFECWAVIRFIGATGTV